ncbi:hypothetical protein AOQ84DRAFT_52089 [Glonium stellatum]|uniref:Uncharacterized protein n=1 Tax=Glonium stellatum TaxID=574774 RepID=A0A8E2EZN9_9PEZI|nr:hypothetical protein AOQ84DRAFT_52089 [Glonium stellatum]
MGVKANDKAEFVQGEAKLDPEQWRRFLKFTNEEAKTIVRTGRGWGDVRPNEKKEILERINNRLREDESPEVDLDIINWRMPKAIRSTSVAENEQIQGELSGSTDQPEKRRLPFDPIRDSMQG